MKKILSGFFIKAKEKNKASALATVLLFCTAGMTKGQDIQVDKKGQLSAILYNCSD